MHLYVNFFAKINVVYYLLEFPGVLQHGVEVLLVLLALLPLGLEFLLLLEFLGDARLPQPLPLGALVGLHVDGRLQGGVRAVAGEELKTIKKNIEKKTLKTI